jgi:hypothetical protein
MFTTLFLGWLNLFGHFLWALTYSFALLYQDIDEVLGPAVARLQQQFPDDQRHQIDDKIHDPCSGVFWAFVGMYEAEKIRLGQRTELDLGGTTNARRRAPHSPTTSLGLRLLYFIMATIKCFFSRVLLRPVP